MFSLYIVWHQENVKNKQHVKWQSDDSAKKEKKKDIKMHNENNTWIV